jgi:hypothetical protein
VRYKVRRWHKENRNQCRREESKENQQEIKMIQGERIDKRRDNGKHLDDTIPHRGEEDNATGKARMQLKKERTQRISQVKY